MSTRNRALSIGAFFVCLHLVFASAVAVFDTPSNAEMALTLMQASARLQPRASYDPKVQPPRMYVSEGCDGSTATLQHAVRILAVHGLNAEAPEKNREMLIPEGNSYFAGGVGIMDSLRMMKNDLANQGQVLVFKSILHRDMIATLSQSMVEMGTLAVYVTRSNPLDQLVCMIRDCWLTLDKYGKPVDDDGKPTDMCFERRGQGNEWGKDSEESNKAWINATVQCPSHIRSLLDENLNRLQDVTSSGYKEFLKAGYQGPRLSYEVLISFEKGGESNIQASLDQWQQLLVAWGVTPNMDKVRQYLESHAGTWAKHNHVDTIYNYGEVKAELQRLGRQALLSDE